MSHAFESMEVHKGIIYTAVMDFEARLVEEGIPFKLRQATMSFLLQDINVAFATAMSDTFEAHQGRMLTLAMSFGRTCAERANDREYYDRIAAAVKEAELSALH